MYTDLQQSEIIRTSTSQLDGPRAHSDSYLSSPNPVIDAHSATKPNLSALTEKESGADLRP